MELACLTHQLTTLETKIFKYGVPARNDMEKLGCLTKELEAHFTLVNRALSLNLYSEVSHEIIGWIKAVNANITRPQFFINNVFKREYTSIKQRVTKLADGPHYSRRFKHLLDICDFQISAIYEISLKSSILVSLQNNPDTFPFPVFEETNNFLRKAEPFLRSNSPLYCPLISKAFNTCRKINQLLTARMVHIGKIIASIMPFPFFEMEQEQITLFKAYLFECPNSNLSILFKREINKEGLIVTRNHMLKHCNVARQTASRKHTCGGDC